ncbi:hypothetical protein BsWGS_14509 [Bradybaena similaris]
MEGSAAEHKPGATDLCVQVDKPGATDLCVQVDKPGATDLYVHVDKPGATYLCVYVDKPGAKDLCVHVNNRITDFPEGREAEVSASTTPSCGNDHVAETETDVFTITPP